MEKSTTKKPAAKTTKAAAKTTASKTAAKKTSTRSRAASRAAPSLLDDDMVDTDVAMLEDLGLPSEASMIDEANDEVATPPVVGAHEEDDDDVAASDREADTADEGQEDGQSSGWAPNSDDLPSVGKLTRMIQRVEVTLSLSQSTLDYLSKQAKKHEITIDDLMRKLTDSYVDGERRGVHDRATPPKAKDAAAPRGRYGRDEGEGDGADRPRRSYTPRPRFERSDAPRSFAPRKSWGDREGGGGRDFDAPRRAPRRDFGDRPERSGGYGGGFKRDFADRGERSGGGYKRDYGSRSDAPRSYPRRDGDAPAARPPRSAFADKKRYSR